MNPKQLALSVLYSIASAIKHIVTQGEAKIEPVTNQGIALVESMVENLVPAGSRPLVTSLVTTADALGHAAVVKAVDTPAVALLEVAGANVQSAIGHIESDLGAPASDVPDGPQDMTGDGAPAEPASNQSGTTGIHSSVVATPGALRTS